MLLVIKLFSYSVFRLLLLTGLTAQTVDVDAIIQKTSQIYETWGGAFVKFTANIQSKTNSASESFEGTIRMKNDKFLLSTPEMTTWFDGTTQWTYMDRTNEVNISPSSDDSRFLNPINLLQDYKKDFSVSYSGESTSINAKMAYDLIFIPKTKGDIEKVDVQIEKSTSLPTKFIITMRNQIFGIVINEMKADKPSDEIFTFSKTSFPNAEIIDLR